jgi:multidrug efflux pump subunit AcrA (membrane-fusion protein)
MMEEVFVLPRQALRDNNTVWIMADDKLLKIKPVKPIRTEKDEVFIKDGITPGDKIILTNLTGAANGMKLRAIGGDDS